MSWKVCYSMDKSKRVKSRKAKLNIVMSNSLGFGGHNASIILKKWEEK